MRALNVAEKPSVAKELANILGGGRSISRPGLSQYNTVYEFDYEIQRQHVHMVVTSITGHLMETAYVPEFQRKKWHEINPVQCFDAPVVKVVPEKNERLRQSLEREARTAQMLILWLDCDREGENISFEVIQVCTAVNPRLRVLRARFSALIPRDIHAACQALVPPNQLDSDAVEARQELDLRIGAAFTRLLTLRYRNKLDGVTNMVSFGPCQFPTLGFVVDREIRIRAFEPERFWRIQCTHAVPEQRLSASFSWSRGHLFDHAAAVALYAVCMQRPVARVISAQKQVRRKWRPLPLTTVEMQKAISMHLRISAHRTMEVAESLYQRGFLSYPRTETDAFPSGFDFQALIANQTASRQWGAYADELLHQGRFKLPRAGSHNDQSHPPIHPVRFTDELRDDDAKVYEFVVRHFLACCSDDAIGQQTSVVIDINGETFSAHGLMVEQLNYLRVYTYERWSESTLPVYAVGDEFAPTTLELTESETVAPPLLTERELLAAMERHGIGTDATMATHIETIQERNYAVKVPPDRFRPTELGLALVMGFQRAGLDLHKPHLRAAMEAEMRRISGGERARGEVVAEGVAVMRGMLESLQRAVPRVDEVMLRYFRPVGGGPGSGAGGAGGAGAVDLQSPLVARALTRCGKCAGPMDLRAANNERAVCCGRCGDVFALPSKGEVLGHGAHCPICGYGVLEVTPERGGNKWTLCPSCFSAAPPEFGGTPGDRLPCFKCTHPTCERAGRAGISSTLAVGPCPTCRQGELEVRKRGDSFFVGCSRYRENCRTGCRLPGCISVGAVDQECTRCTHTRLRLLQFRFEPNTVPHGVPLDLRGCIGGCDPTVNQLLEMCAAAPLTADVCRPQAAASAARAVDRLTTGLRSAQHDPGEQPFPGVRPGYGGPGLGGAGGRVARPGGTGDGALHGGHRLAGPVGGGSYHTGDAAAYGFGAGPGNTGSGAPRVAERTAECFRCHQIGHFASNCPNAPVAGGFAGGGGGGSSFASAGAGADAASGLCFTCKQPGHMSRDCPQRAGAGAAGGGGMGAGAGFGFGGFGGNSGRASYAPVTGSKRGRGAGGTNSAAKRR